MTEIRGYYAPDVVAVDDEARARAVLGEMQARISRGPSVALGLEDSGATAESVRAAFLALTKQFHPARFGRMSTDIQRLSNEVFLGIKAAHELLLKSLGVATRGGSTMQTGGMPVLTAEGTNRTQQRPGTPPAGAAALPRWRGPGSPPGPAIPRTLTPTKHGARPTPASAPPASRPADASADHAAAGRRRRRGRERRRSEDRPQRTACAPVTPPQPPTPSNPPIDRAAPVSWQPLQKTTPVFDERVELQQVLDALGQKNWGAAKALLNGLAARVPHRNNIARCSRTPAGARPRPPAVARTR